MSRTIIRLDFATGAWWVLREGMNNVLGRNPAGLAFAGTPSPGGLRFEPSAHSGLDTPLDDPLPTRMLMIMLDRSAGAVRDVRATDQAGVFQIVFQLPRGSRKLALSEIPSTELDRWSGPEKIDRTVEVLYDRPNRRVLSMRAQDINPSEWFTSTYATSDCSRGAVQVTSRHPDPDVTITLVECTWSETSSAAEFEPARVEAAVIALKAPATPETPGTPAPQPGQSTPTSTAFGVHPLVIAGSAVVLLAGGLWCRRLLLNRRRG